jgi:outer membrane protein OmpA-like peptidoglycan-associated protein
VWCVGRPTGRAGARLAVQTACALACALVSSRPVQANPPVNVQRVQPSPFAGDLVGMRSTAVPEWAAGLGLFATDQRDPLHVQYKTPSGTRTYDLVDRQAGVDLAASVVLGRRVALAAAMTSLAIDRGRSGLTGLQPPSGPALGDARLAARWYVLPRLGSGAGLAVETEVSLPTATPDRYAGDGSVTVTPRVVVDARVRDTVLALQVGAHLRQSQPLGQHLEGTELRVGVGLQQAWLDDRLSLLGEAHWVAPVDRPLDRNGSALEQGGLAVCVGGGVQLFGVAGGGVLRGLGDTSLRISMGLRVQACGPGPRVPDRDGDHIPDLEDRCPDVPGPPSAHPLAHGCPQFLPRRPAQALPDVDGDGVPDLFDACPGLPGLRAADPRKHGCPATGINQTFQIEQRTEFEIDKWEIGPGFVPILQEVVKFLTSHPDIRRVLVEGHTDDTFTEAYNLQLSQKRAQAVFDWLVAHGVAKGRLIVAGYGFSRPIADNATEAGRQRNRRVAFTVLEIAPPPVHRPAPSRREE